MIDLIDRQTALKAFGLSEKTRKYGGDHSGYETAMLYEIQDVLEALPSIGPGESAVWYKPTGMMPPEFTGQYRCSNCGELAMRDWKHHRQTLTNFCPNCGKPMRKEGDNEQN